MKIEIQLLHAAPGHRVVLARAQHDGDWVAMALGEAESAEAAEDRARLRLRQQLAHHPGPQPKAPAPPPTPAPPAPALPAPPASLPTATGANPWPAAADQPTPSPEPEPASTSTPEPSPTPEHPIEAAPAEPDDWSAELASLELQLRRIGWNREQEASYLQRAFGHSSRAMITSYGDLRSYLQALEQLAAGEDPSLCRLPLQRAALMQQCDALLTRLDWDAGRGRRLLESSFGRSSRQQLSDSQLLEFNIQLEEALLSQEQGIYQEQGVDLEQGVGD